MPLLLTRRDRLAREGLGVSRNGDAFALASPAVQPWQLPNSRDEAFFFETVTLSLWQGEEEGVLGEGHARRLEGFLLCSDSCCVRMILKIASLQWGRKMLYEDFSNDLGIPVGPVFLTSVPELAVVARELSDTRLLQLY